MSPFEAFLTKALSIPLVKTALSVTLVSIIAGIPIAIARSRKEKRVKQAKLQEYKAIKDFDTKTDDE